MNGATFVNVDDFYVRNELAIARIRGRLFGSSSAHIETYGCQMNEHDSEKLRAMLTDMGYSIAAGFSDADLILFNTCCVRENAELRVFGNLGRVKHLKKTKPGLLAVLCGCMMQQPHIVEQIQAKYPFVDLVFGTHNLHDFPLLLDETMERSLSGEKTLVRVMQDGNEIVEGLPAIRKRDAKSYVNINYGCNNFCTYCIVPYTRGRERSRTADSIVSEVTELVKRGSKEVMLLGQNVNSYGKEFGIDFADLLRRIDAETGIRRIRFMTSHPKDISKKLIDVMAESQHICKQLHLPVQSGSDRILKAMNRGYDISRYRKMVEYARLRIPNLCLSTDVIVGFPGETDADFQETVRLVKEMDYDSAYTYIYSKRTGTPAANFDNQVEDAVKSERLKILVEEVNRGVIRKMQDFVNTVQEVLVEAPSNRSELHYMGRTDGGITCTVSRDSCKIGEIVPMKIVKARNFSLHGEVIGGEGYGGI